MNTIRSAYLHVPFCSHRCGYCDFTLVAGRNDLIGSYLAAMERELATVADRPELATLYFGGGTPTLLSPEQLRQLCDLVHRTFTISTNTEWTVEANPAELTGDKLDVLKSAGVNRISLGVQAYDANLLQFLERDHRLPEIERSLNEIRNRFEHFSVDLMFGIPGQSLELWHTTIDRTLSFEPPHVSTYGLTIERGTAFWSREQKGVFQKPAEELEAEMYRMVIDRLNTAGIEQYELSNFARPGFRSRHNQVYWHQEPYYGFGPGAAKYVNGVRELNHRSVTTWLKRVHTGEDPIAERDVLSDDEKAREQIILALRTCDGLHIPTFETRTKLVFAEFADEPLTKHLATGNVELVDDCLRLTHQGKFVADLVVADFL